MLAAFVRVGIAVHHECGADARENTERPLREGNTRSNGLESAFSVVTDQDIGQVSRMEWVIDVRISVACGSGIKMAAGTFEFTRAIGLLVDVHRMLSGSQDWRVPRELERHLHEPLFAVKFYLDKIRPTRNFSVAPCDIRFSAHDLLAMLKLMHVAIVSPTTMSFQC